MPDRAPSDAFHAIVGTLDYPMFVVTACANGEEAGCLVGFTTQCSIDPPRFLVCISKVNRTWHVAEASTTLVVHVLNESQHDLAEIFGGTSGDVVDKFAAVEWRRGPDGVPVLAHCDWFAGRIVSRADLGDHVGYVLSPFAGGHVGDDDQLSYQEVRDVDPGKPA
jgi:flavin reductase (DIM6/NTAB) family NADH-FMN oxidoreductase RutF